MAQSEGLRSNALDTPMASQPPTNVPVLTIDLAGIPALLDYEGV